MTESEKIENKIDALFAKASSTEFEAERDALIAKALELASKYGIEAHKIRERRESGEKPTRRTIEIKAPYINSKLEILLAIAQQQGCQVVVKTLRGRLTGGSIIVGYERDIEITIHMYESLKNQAIVQMLRESSSQPSYVNRKSFKSSFLIGYAMGVRSKFRDIEALNKTAESTALVLDRKDKVSEAVNLISTATRNRNTSNLDGNAVIKGKSSGRASDIGLSRIGNQGRALTA
jgi:hypothetical protein